MTYEPKNVLFLWFLGAPDRPVLVGDLELAQTGRGVSLRYDDEWLERGFALSEDLPLVAETFLAAQRDEAAGAVDDARPDRWGERVIRAIDKPPRLSLLEYLYFAGDDRFGALGVSTSRSVYDPRRGGPLPTLADVPTMQELVRKILANEPVPEREKRLVSPGASLGGAMPKALLAIEGTPFIVKLAPDAPTDVALIEHAAMTLAKKAGIRVARTRAIELPDGHAVAIERFDRRAARRVHALSAKVVLQAAGERYGYPELAQVLRRRGVAEGDVNVIQMRELFRRMVFNILIDNTDDHEKNHVLLLTDAQRYELSPAFDVLPSGQALGLQQMRVGANEADATLDNAVSMSTMFALDGEAAARELQRVVEVVDGWKEHFAACGVKKGDLESLAAQIDRPFLADQRAARGANTRAKGVRKKRAT